MLLIRQSFWFVAAREPIGQSLEMSLERPLLLLLALSLLSFAGLLAGGFLVLQGIQQKKRLQNRVKMAVGFDTPRPTSRPTAFVAPARTDKNRSAAAIFGRLFRVNFENTEIYPVRWWLVVIATLLIANVGRILSRALLGDALSLLATPIVWILLSRMFFGWAENRQCDKLLGQFPDALGMIVRSVRVGIPVMEAMRAVSQELPAPTGEQFARLAEQLSVGGSLEDAILEMARRANLPEYRFFATAISLQNQTGGRLSDTLDSLGDVIRKRIALKLKGRAMTSEARASTMVLAALPILTGCGMWALNRKYMNVLIDTATGHKFLGAAILSLCIGLAVMRTIIRKTLR